MAAYSFVTIWRLEAPAEAVWDALWASERWPEWWPSVESVVELEPAGADGLGSLRRYTWRTPLLYKLRFDARTIRAERPGVLEIRAEGELRGTGLWHLSQTGSVTTARYDWQVETTKRWMNVLAPVARPFFRWNHDAVMRAGGRGLAAFLESRLVR